MKQRKLFYLMAVSMLLALFLGSCSEKDGGGDPPELPPMEALQIDFSFFEQTPGKKSTEGYQNFLHAAGNFFVWQTAQVVYMAIPVAAYAAAFNHTPVYLGDNKWQWSYSVSDDEYSITATVTTERLNNEEFSVKMELSLNEAESQLWFDGVVRYDRTAASWNLYDVFQSAGKVLTIDWNKDWETELSDITYTMADGSGYLTYGIVDDVYDAYYTISGEGNTVNIEYNTETKEGRVKNPQHFQDSDWHCWDSNLMDTDCPQ